MRLYILASPLVLGALALAPSANAATLYVSPTGTATAPGCTTRATPCSLASAASSATAGDVVVLMDGVYQEPLVVANSGTSAAWITFQADECATPIIEGEGSGPAADTQTGGVHSVEGEYLRFKGLVARGWNIGFGNAWAGGTEMDLESNGHWEIEHCISYSNGRTGFTFFSAQNFSLKHSISAHNGSSTAHSWSSGVTLFEAEGTNVVEGNVSFENTDAERRTDGSGFIVDEESNGVTFVNNLAFGNSGSCLRLTRSSGTKFINNTCYHNSQFGSQATGPTNPGEIYFTNGGVTQEGVTFMNNVIVGTGQAPAGSTPIQNQPPSGWTDNVVTTGTVDYFTAPTGTNPSFVPAASASNLLGQGTTGNGAPTNDLGFDPKCLVKRTPVMVGQVARVSTWQFDIDIDYIKSIGGVGKCFSPGMRSGAPDIGAYKAGAVPAATPGSCVAPPIGGMGGMGGMAGASAGGAAGTGVAAGMGGTMDAGGAPSAGGAINTGGNVAMGGSSADAGAPAAGGAPAGSGGLGAGGIAAAAGAPPAAGGSVGVGGSAPMGTGGTGNVGTGGSTPTAGAPGTGGGVGVGGSATTGGVGGGAGAEAEEVSGCGCRLAPEPGRSKWVLALGLLGLGVVTLGRRRGRRSGG
jgi:MYXO-CTERM domain-containing protein